MIIMTNNMVISFFIELLPTDAMQNHVKHVSYTKSMNAVHHAELENVLPKILISF